MRKFFYAAAVALVAMFGLTSSADAAFAVRITTTVGSQTITDGGVGDLDGSANGTITVNYGDSAYHLVGTISFTNTPGTPSKGILDVSYNINTNGGETGGAATLEVSATGYTLPNGSPLLVNDLINGNGSGSGTLSSQGYITNNGALFSTTGGATTGPQGPFNINGSYGSSASALYSGGMPYTLTQVLRFNLSPGSNTSGDSQMTTATPAPAGLVLALTAAPVFGLGTWVRRRRTA